MQKAAPQILSIVASALLCLVWIESPVLKPLSLQFTAGIALLYMGIKKLSGSKLHHIGPKNSTFFELLLFFSAALLLVGSTGGVQSAFLPLFYVLILIAVFIFELSALVTLGISLPFFLYLLLPLPPTAHEFTTLLSFPLILPLMVLAKIQYNEMKTMEKEMKKSEDGELESLLFFSTYLKPKIAFLHELSNYPDENIESIQKQIVLLEEDLEVFTEKCNQTKS
jgi:hypothetical protein